MSIQDENDRFVQELNLKLEREFVGRSELLVKQLRKLVDLAQTDLSVMILGETGTGKELCARAIHQLSRRAAEPFHALNCATFSPDRFESELFGHTKGAFTGAIEAAGGAVQAAEGGTIFLDESHSLPLPLQGKLLRFLDDGSFIRVGSDKISKADVRIISAGNEDLDEKVRAKEFRRDLRARLSAAKITMPPLRDRPEDIPLLAAHFLAEFIASERKRPMELSPEAREKLVRYDWPENIRELRSVIESAAACSKRSVIEASEIELPDSAGESVPASYNRRKKRARDDWEKHEIQHYLIAAGGNISQAARDMGKNVRFIRQKMREYNIPTGYGRPPSPRLPSIFPAPPSSPRPSPRPGASW